MTQPQTAPRSQVAHGPLTGVRVLVLAGMGPTPFASMLLADLGADVVRITRPPSRAARALKQTDAMGPEHDIANRGVRSVPVDLKSAQGRAAILELARAADVFIEGYRPGVTERLGLGPQELAEQNPRLVYARLTGFGQQGPLSHAAGHDINYVAQSGVLNALRRVDGTPMPPINLLGDYAGGGLVAAFGIVSAVLSARTTGHGQTVDAAMIDGVALLSARIQGLRAAGVYSDEAGTNYLDTGAPFYDTYRCSDGRFLAVGALESDFYAQFLAGLGVDTSDWPAQDDEANWPILRTRIAEVLGTRTRDEWAAAFEATDACVSPVLDFEEAAAHPHNADRDLYVRAGGVLHPSPAPRFSRTPCPAPSVPTAEFADLAELRNEWRSRID